MAALEGAPRGARGSTEGGACCDLCSRGGGGTEEPQCPASQLVITAKDICNTYAVPAAWTWHFDLMPAAFACYAVATTIPIESLAKRFGERATKARRR